MDWSRDLLRAWIGFTVLWFVGCALVAYKEWPEVPKPDPFAKYATKKNPFEDLVPKKEPNVFDQFDPNPVREHVQRFAIYAFSWPAFFFVLGWGMLWIGRGFRS
jgi:hypothetical protein